MKQTAVGPGELARQLLENGLFVVPRKDHEQETGQSVDLRHCLIRETQITSIPWLGLMILEVDLQLLLVGIVTRDQARNESVYPFV